MKNILPLLPILIIVGINFSSCKNASDTNAQPLKTTYQQPVVHPLKFISVKKINPASIKTITINPVVKKLDFDRLPRISYDTAISRPVHYDTEEAKINYNALPESNFDIEKLPSKSLKFTTYKLAPPKLIKSGQPLVKDANLSLFELAQAQGLQGALISCVFSDNTGFLWIATSQGLYRYDGENLLLYISGPMDTYLMGMVEDKQGRIWISRLDGGVEILDTANGTLKKTGPVSGSSNNNICYILQDRQQRIWASSFGPAGIYIIEPKTLAVKWLNKSHGLASDNVNGLTMDDAGQVWVASYKGISIINPATKKIKTLSKLNGLKSDTIASLFCDHNGNIWMSNSGANVFNPHNNSFKTIKDEKFFKKNPLIGFSEDSRGRIWVASQKNGLAIIDQPNHTLQNLKQANGLNGDFILNPRPDKKNQMWIPTLKGLNKQGYNNNLVEHIGNIPAAALAEDKQGFIWYGTSDGLNAINRKNKTSVHLGVRQGMGNDTIQYIVEKHNKIFVGNNGGLDIIDSSGKTITHIGVKQGLLHPLIESVMVDNHGNVWLGGLYNGAYLYNPDNKTLKRIGKAQGLDENGVADIKQDEQGNIWLSTAGDVYEIDPNLTVIRRLHTVGGNKTLLIDHYGNTWIGTPAGIFIADNLNKKLISFSTEQGLINSQVISLLKYNKRIYAGTLKGITEINPPADGFSADKKWDVNSFGIRHGIVKLNANFFLTDVITHNGLYCWGDNGISVLDLSKKDTAASPVYISGINIMDDHQYFTGNNPAIKNKISWDKVAGPDNLPVDLQLAYNQNYVQFNYDVLNLMPHDTTWYQYRLRGADKNWNAITSSTLSKSYFNLSPGQYTFEVAGKSSDEGWGKTVSLSFTINPPWWQTWWAYLFDIVLFAGIIWVSVYFRSRKLTRDKRLLEHKVHVRTEEVLQQKEEIEAQRDSLEQALGELKTTQTQLIQSEKMASLGELTAGIAHEIQNPLNFVNNFSEVNTELIDELQEEIDKGNYDEVKTIANDIKGNQQKISQHGKRADFIVKGMLQHSRTNTGERQLTNINVLADEFFKLSYHGLRAKDKSFNAAMVTHFDADLPQINVVQQDIGRVLLNLFNNAFYAVNRKSKTAEAGYKPEVSVSTSLENGQVVIKVKDNGVGIPAAIKEKIMQPFFTTKPTGEGTGLGLSLTYDMVVKGHGGSIQVNSVDSEGSEFIISLPI